MKRSIKIIIIFYIIILSFIFFMNIRDYYFYMEDARKYIREGNEELAELCLDYAHSRIRGIFIALSFSIPFLYLIRKYK